MYKPFYIIFLLLFSNAISAQPFVLDTIAELLEVVETSGLLYHQGVLITHNDSGGQPILYEIDTLSGQVVREVVLANASNQDWEDLAGDEDYLYVADFGNNVGNRTNLRIYRASWEDYFASDTIRVDTIAFAYAEQTDFSVQTLQHRFDAEALIAHNDSLYIFTKNWLADTTYRYGLPVIPGSYILVAQDRFSVPGLITGADYFSETGKTLLTGFTFGAEPFISEWSGGIQPGEVKTWMLPLQGSQKMEAISWSSAHQAWLSTEAATGFPARLYRMNIDEETATQTVDIATEMSIFPQPVQDWLFCENPDLNAWTIRNLQGAYLLRTAALPLDVSQLPNGLYLLSATNKNGHQITRLMAIQR